MKVVLFATLLVCLLAVSPFEKLNAVVRQDDCSAKVIDLLKPEFDAKVEELKSSNSLNAQVEVLALIEKGNKMLNKCNANKPAVKVGDAVEWEGVNFLLASNCFKDVGIVLLLADTIVQDPKDYVNDIMVTIFGVILARQGLADCSQFEHHLMPK